MDKSRTPLFIEGDSPFYIGDSPFLYGGLPFLYRGVYAIMTSSSD